MGVNAAEEQVRQGLSPSVSEELKCFLQTGRAVNSASNEVVSGVHARDRFAAGKANAGN